jgi:hypothetical protein
MEGDKRHLPEQEVIVIKIMIAHANADIKNDAS